MYVLKGCPYCESALNLSTKLKLDKNVIVVKPEEKEAIKERNGMNTFPQIFYQGKSSRVYKIGGNDDFHKMVDMIQHVNNNGYPNTMIQQLRKDIPQ